MTATTTAPNGAPATESGNDQRIRRLNDASIARFTDIDDLLDGRLGDGQLIADELLSVEGLGLDLTAEQRRVLAREEVASLLAAALFSITSARPLRGLHMLLGPPRGRRSRSGPADSDQVATCQATVTALFR